MLRATLILLCCYIISEGAKVLPEVLLNENRDFVDPLGRQLLFHGFNSVYKKPPYHNELDVSDNRLGFFKKWGFNVVRLGVLWHPSVPLGPGRINDTYLKAVERQVDRFSDVGIYVILDMHQDSLSTMYGSYDAIPLWLLKNFSAPPWLFKYPWPMRKMPSGDWEGYVTYACQKSFQDIYNNRSAAWNHWGDFWAEVARRFKNRSNVLGYELMNEPFAGNIYTNPLRSIPGYAGSHNLAPVYDYLVRRIRAIDKKKFIFFEGVTWSVIATSKHDAFAGPGFSYAPGSLEDPEETKRSVFSYHYYCPLIPIANMSENFSSMRRIMCDEFIMPKMFSSTKGIAKGLKTARFLTEFGICVPDENPESANSVECRAVMNGADANLQSWTYWNAKFFDENEKPVDVQVKPFSRFYPMATAGDLVGLEFDTWKGSGFCAFSVTSLTLHLAAKGESIADIFIPLEFYYKEGHKIEITPRSIWYNASADNDHVIQLHANADELKIGSLVEVNITPQ